ncbi:MAG: hypothetical protein GX577_03625 [Leptolinea sp.]|nr:hypothetical protein [Leptolinea sp.]
MTEIPGNGASKSVPRILIAIVILAMICIGITFCAGLGFWFFSSGDGEEKPASTGAVEMQSTKTTENQTWLVLLYFDADDPVLEEDILFDLNEAEMAGSTKRVKIVAQIDRNKKGFTGDGNWTGARRYEIIKDSDLTAIHSKVIEDLGEVDMSNPDTLVDFTVWAMKTYPADRHVLILSDHGMGWPGGWTDADNHSEDFVFISLSRLEKSLKTITSQTGSKKLDLIGLDACLMGMLEVYSAVAPYASIAVASEEVEPGLGWAYAEFLSALNSNPSMKPTELSNYIVSTYIQKDQRIINQNARAVFLKKYGLDPDTSEETLIEAFTAESTLAAVNLSALPDVYKNLDAFVTALKAINQKKVADSRVYSRAFTNTFDDNFPSPYLDLSHFAAMAAKRTGDKPTASAASNLRISIDKAVIAETHGKNRRGSTGISIFFPVSDLYWNENIGVELYTTLSSRFVKAALWDDFLAYHYADQDFEKGVPEISQRIDAPGLGQNIEIAPLNLSPASVKPGESIRLKTSISGSQIAHIYLLTLLVKDKDNYLVYYFDYFRGIDVREEDGVFYPVWNLENGKIPIDIQWVPSSFGVCNGSLCSFSHLEPEVFGKLDEESLYSSAGRYVFAGESATRDARMYFRNDEDARMTRITGFTGGTNTGIAAAAINPRQGDEWQFLDTWLERSADGGFMFTYHEGNRLAFEDEPFYFGIRPSNAGQYRVAIMVEDMDGNDYFQFAPLEITE